MGCGKSTIGRRFAKDCRFDFLDLDREIEARNGVSVATIFEIEGECGFRARESQLLEDARLLTGKVVATGGGIVLRTENRARLVSSGTVIYLHASPKLLFTRLRNDRTRPLIQVADPLAKISELVERRDPLYREVADIVVEAGGEMNTVVDEIKTKIEFLCRN